ncbi:hypothetical protein GCM10027089_42070 [Nocardia thraciensis]
MLAQKSSRDNQGWWPTTATTPLNPRPHHSTMTTATIPPADHTPEPDHCSASPVVHWPVPSGLEHWWTEVMDGAVTPPRLGPGTPGLG